MQPWSNKELAHKMRDDELLTINMVASAAERLDYLDPLLEAVKPVREALEGFEEDPGRCPLWEHPAAMNLTLKDLRELVSAADQYGKGKANG